MLKTPTARAIALLMLIAAPLSGLVLLGAGPAKPDIEVFFSPKGGCTDAVVREVNAAKTTLVPLKWHRRYSVRNQRAKASSQ